MTMKNPAHFLVIWTLFLISVTSAFPDGEGRQLSFPAKFIKGNKRLTNHDITTIKVPDLDLCELQCYHEPNCVSINFKVIPDDDGLHECELNNATHQSHDSQLEDKDGYVYKGAESACDWPHESCNKGTCQSGYTNKGYRCVCPQGWTSDHCEKAIDDCIEDKNNCGNKMCVNTDDGDKCIDPKLVAWFPLNATFNISEIEGRVSAELEDKANVSLAPGPDGRLGGSYKLTQGSHIKFATKEDGTLDVCYSMTIQFWLYYTGFKRSAIIVRYWNKRHSLRIKMFLSGRTNQQAGNVTVTRDNVKVFILEAPFSAGRWTFVAITFNHTSGEAKLWINAVVVEEIAIKDNIELSTHYQLKIGSNNFEGRITQLQIYNYPLTKKEINESFTIPVSAFSLNSKIISGNKFYLGNLSKFLAGAVGNDSAWLLCYHYFSKHKTGNDRGDVAKFHQRCDNKNHTVTIIRKESFIFGGYTDIPWESRSSNDYGKTLKAFIFSLNNSRGLPPFKCSVTDKKWAIRRASNYGPSFGKDGIQIHNGKAKAWIDDKTYKPPTGLTFLDGNKTILAGDEGEFRDYEYEVFYLT